MRLKERESIVKVKKNGRSALLGELSFEKWTKNSQLWWGRGWLHSKFLQRKCITCQVPFPFLDKIFIFPSLVSDQEWPQSHIIKTFNYDNNFFFWIALDFISLYNSKLRYLKQFLLSTVKSNWRTFVPTARTGPRGQMFRIRFCSKFQIKRSCIVPTRSFLCFFIEHRLTKCNSSIRQIRTLRFVLRFSGEVFARSTRQKFLRRSALFMLRAQTI